MPSTATTATRTVVEDLLRRIGEGDHEGVAALFAERADWKLNWPEAEHGRPATPWIRHRSSRADASAHFRELTEHHVPEQAATRVERVLVDGQEAVVLGEIRQTARSTGRPYRARFALHLTVEGGSVTRYHVYEDNLAVAQAFDATRSDGGPGDPAARGPLR
ncbi:nuclear transport factor 2 family protein [Nocardiopsis sp. NPDC050513]|uniref:nuclear transport factor 2 family protein n=1 Tax=Nocardiopsis sp. NPDC050513 TaxID=3364338 RepID=UPI00379BC97E